MNMQCSRRLSSPVFKQGLYSQAAGKANILPLTIHSFPEVIFEYVQYESKTTVCEIWVPLNHHEKKSGGTSVDLGSYLL